MPGRHPGRPVGLQEDSPANAPQTIKRVALDEDFEGRRSPGGVDEALQQSPIGQFGTFPQQHDFEGAGQVLAGRTLSMSLPTQTDNAAPPFYYPRDVLMHEFPDQAVALTGPSPLALA